MRPSVQLVDERRGESDEPCYLGLVAVDPRAARLVADGHESVVLLPGDESPLGADDVLLPPHLPQV
jgi:hypothetical protein